MRNCANTLVRVYVDIWGSRLDSALVVAQHKN